MHRRHILAAAVAAGLAAGAGIGSAQAQTPVKIGMITTLSGPGGYIGADVRDAFQLAIEQGGGRLGGVPVELVVEDDNFRPPQGKQIAERFIRNDGIKLVTGIIFSNIANAAVPDVVDAGGFYVSPNAAPSNFAGVECHPNYFVVSWQNDNLHESAGQATSELGYRRAFILAPNYQAGRDALTGFKRLFQGEIVGEVYTRLDQTDYAAEMAQIRAANPDVVFQFHPGGLGIAFLRQYQQAGLLASIPMVVAAPSMDHTIMNTVGDAAVGIHLTSHWFDDFDNAQNRQFVEAFRAKYDRMPTAYAAQGYDTALAIGAALSKTGGNLDDAAAFRAAMTAADFESVRGEFRFNTNQHPIQDWWMGRVEKAPDGTLYMRTLRQVLDDHADVYAERCSY